LVKILKISISSFHFQFWQIIHQLLPFLLIIVVAIMLLGQPMLVAEQILTFALKS